MSGDNVNPWDGLVVPNTASALNARRVDAMGKWDFFWARGSDGRCLLVLRHGAESKPHGPLPSIKGVGVSSSPGDAWEGSQAGHVLTLKLQDESQRDIFYHLCRDIIASTEAVGTERDAVSKAVARTWRWHHLLRGGRTGRLSLDEQRGLFGELLFLEERLMRNLSVAEAVTAWCGPLGAPKDFELGQVAIEVKTRRGNAPPRVTISSEHQLDGHDGGQVYLVVTELDSAPPSENGLTLTQLAMRIVDRITIADPGVLDLFESRLISSGFAWEDSYVDERWLAERTSLYRVESDFPRIVAADVPLGASNVRYVVSLSACAPYLIDEPAAPPFMRAKDVS